MYRTVFLSIAFKIYSSAQLITIMAVFVFASMQNLWQYRQSTCLKFILRGFAELANSNL